MPNRLKKPCAQPGCPKLVEAGNTYCEDHRKKQSQYRNKNYDKKRDPKIKKFYSSSQWQKLRNMQLNREPLCEHCKNEGITKEATDVDHIIPIKFDWDKRLKLDNLQSLCHSCHMKKTEEDKKIYNNNGRIDTNITIVAGPPASGKITFVEERKGPNDLVIDLDWIAQGITGNKYYDKPSEVMPFAWEARDAMIERLTRSNNLLRAWIIGGYPKAYKRERLARKLDAKVIVLKVDRHKCIERIRNDDRRKKKWEKWESFVDDWFENYTRSEIDEEIRF